MAEPGEQIELTVEHGHLVETTVYDAELNPVGGSVTAKQGWQLNGHRHDCRCETCRPDIWRLPEVPRG